jgi:NitT/TauT family transport system permease protein
MGNVIKKVLVLLKNLFFKRLVFFIGIIVVWQVLFYTKLYPVQMFPSVKTIWDSLVNNLVNGELLAKTGFSLELIGIGMLIGMLLSVIFTGLAMISKVCRNFVDSIITIAHPLPGIALLPIIILWLGLGSNAIIFVIVHSVLWPMLLNTMTGFSSVPKLYKQLGQNIEMSKIKLVFGIYIPASLPNIYAGLKISWARAWRALISAEMIFGASGTSSGLGFYISQKRYDMDTPAVFAALIVIMLIGILVEDIFFNQLEKRTIGKWGMVSQ